MQIYVNWGSQKYVIKLSNFCHRFLREFTKTFQLTDRSRLSNFLIIPEGYNSRANIPVFFVDISQLTAVEIVEDIFVTIVTLLSYLEMLNKIKAH